MENISKFNDFLTVKGFSILKEYEDERVIIYEKKGLYLKIVHDRNGERFIDLSRTNNKPGWEGWYSMDIIYYLISKLHYGKDGPISFAELSQFFIEHYDEIDNAFSQPNFADTEEALVILKKERGKVLFGYES